MKRSSLTLVITGSIILALIILFLSLRPSFSSLRFGTFEIEVFATNDVHGSFFSQPYFSSQDSNHPSLSNVSNYVNQIRKTKGSDNVVLLDIGDLLQGDIVTYYFNFVDTSGADHIASRVFNYMKYDAAVVGNHDIEAGHSVYDRVYSQLSMPYLAANAIRNDDGKPYFKEYAILSKNGLKIAVIGMTNDNITEWLPESKYKGMSFRPIYSMTDSLVRVVRQKENPDLLFLAIHAGLGNEDSKVLENEALYLASHTEGIDVVFAAHDHSLSHQKVFNGQDSVLVIEAGTKAQNLSDVSISVVKKRGKVISKKISSKIISMEEVGEDAEYDNLFKDDYLSVKSFSTKKIGDLSKTVYLSDAYNGMSSYISLIHIVQLSETGADISFSSPLKKDGCLPAGPILYNDLFTLYKYENTLYMIRMTGEEIQKYLEYSYDNWINHKGSYYNYDSAGGLVYTVKKSAPYGRRVHIISMADGTPFKKDATYKVAITSYRASGAGNLLYQAGVDVSKLDQRMIRSYTDIRDILYDYITSVKYIDPDTFSEYKKLGHWKFI